MTPTDAARQLLDTDHDHPMARNALMAKHGPAIARALLDATERIAALEAENAVMRKCLTHIRDNYDCDRDATWHEKHCRCCKSDAALSYKYAPTLTPEGGGK